MKKFIYVFLLTMVCCACSSTSNEFEQQTPSSSSISEPPSILSSDSESSTNALSTQDELNVTPKKVDNTFFRVNLSDDKEPESIKMISRDSIWSFTMSPSCDFILEERGHINKIYDCVNNSLIENIYDGSLGYIRFINGNQIAFEERMQQWVERPDDKADEDCAIMQSDAQVTFTYFYNDLKSNLGISVYIEDFDFDMILQRYYITAFFTNGNFEYDILCAEYDKDFNLLNCIITENLELFRNAKDYLVSPTIIALGNRKVYTAQKVEFDFNNLSSQRINYEVDAVKKDIRNRGVNYDWSTIPANRNNQYLTAVDDSAQVITYINNDLHAIYGTPLIDITNEGGFEVETEQSILKIVGINGILGGAAWAPDEGFFFTGICEEYRWELPPNLKDYLQADSYTFGIFKVLPDNSVRFIAPLPDRMTFIGEDVNSLSYFFKRGS